MRKLVFVLVSAATAAMALGPPAAAREPYHGKVDIASLRRTRPASRAATSCWPSTSPARSRSKISASSGTALT